MRTGSLVNGKRRHQWYWSRLWKGYWARCGSGNITYQRAQIDFKSKKPWCKKCAKREVK